jgi:SAM-dependent methyltransferase
LLNCPFYLRSKHFFISDLKRLISRLLYNPYRKTSLYGITPITTFDHILRAFYLSSKDRFIDLGCGDGRLCQFASIFYACDVSGIDLLDPLVRKAKKELPLGNFKVCDIRTFNLKNMDFVYFFSTGFGQEQMEQFKRQCLEMKSGAKVITVSQTLKLKEFYIWKRLTLPFVFGKANVYCHIRK